MLISQQSIALSKKLHRRSLAFYAILVLVIIVFSYCLSIAIALLCLTLPIAMISNGIGGIGGLILAAMGLVLSFSILWSLVPRRSKFTAPGVPMNLDTQPRLRALVEDVALRLKERLPAALYITADANAFVTERGGFLGFGSERVMGLGLPLLAGMSVSEFRAVLAHEFAHYYSGDTLLGPRIFSTRSAMIRTLQNLSQRGGFVDWLRGFGFALLLHTLVVGTLVAYWKLFLRITNFVARKQEHRSDELACYIAGPKAMTEGLKRVNMMSAISDSFWPSVIAPVLSAGYRPSIADGFRRYHSAPPIETVALGYVQRLIDRPEVSAYDTHPPLKNRLDKIDSLTVEGDFPTDNSPAIGLLDDVDALEMSLLQFLLPSNQKPLIAIDWDSTGSTVWIPTWRAQVTQHASSLSRFKLTTIPCALEDLFGLGATMRDPPGRLLTREQRAERAYDLVCTALTVRLLDQGWILQMQPGEFSVVKGEARLVPPEVIRDLRRGTTKRSSWQDWCHANELGDVSLVATPAAAASSVS